MAGTSASTAPPTARYRLHLHHSRYHHQRRHRNHEAGVDVVHDGLANYNHSFPPQLCRKAPRPIRETSEQSASPACALWVDLFCAWSAAVWHRVHSTSTLYRQSVVASLASQSGSFCADVLCMRVCGCQHVCVCVLTVRR